MSPESGLPLRSGRARLSGKEISGLAARVLAAAQMPAGCIGAAAEAVEFVEYFSKDGLALLDRCMDDLLRGSWRPLRVLAEAPAAALCDAQGESLLFAGPAIADWITAMAFECGAAALAVVNMTHSCFLASVPYRILGRGLDCSAVFAPRDGDFDGRESRPMSLVGLGDGGEWTLRSVMLAGWPEGLDGVARAWCAASRDATTTEWLDAIGESGGTGLARNRASLAGGRASSLPDAGVELPRNLCLIRATDGASRAGPPVHPTEPVAPPQALSRRGLNETRCAARRDGTWVPEPTWRRLMDFAERTLIPTSEHSRQGAG